jgi:hypothetical protein
LILKVLAIDSLGQPPYALSKVTNFPKVNKRVKLLNRRRDKKMNKEQMEKLGLMVMSLKEFSYRLDKLDEIAEVM